MRKFDTRLLKAIHDIIGHSSLDKSSTILKPQFLIPADVIKSVVRSVYYQFPWSHHNFLLSSLRSTII